MTSPGNEIPGYRGTNVNGSADFKNGDVSVNAIGKLGVFALLFIGGNFLLVPLLAGAALLYGMGVSDLMTALGAGQSTLPAGLLKLTFLLQSLALFVLPALLFGMLFYRGRMVTYFDVRRIPTFWTAIFAVLALIAGYPLVQLAYEANSLIPLADWMIALEDQAATTLGDLLVMESFGSYLLALLLIAVLPALGEELVFRGIVQKQTAQLFKSPVAGVWCAAIIFSLIHFQFGGFLPRVALGAILGYTYLWTGNLWVPILVHFVNNGFQVTVMYATGTDLSEPQDEMDLAYWTVILSVFVLYFAYRTLKQMRTHGQETA